MESSFLTRDQGLSLWSGNTDSKTLDYHRTNPPAKSLQSCPTLCDPIDSSPPGSPVPGILQSMGSSRQEYWSGVPLPSPRTNPAAAAKLLQLCLTLCDPVDCSPPGSSVHGIFQARVLEWRAIAFSRANPREYRIVRTHTKGTTVIQHLASPNTSSTPCRTPHLNNKQNKNTNQITSIQDYHLTPSCPSEEKQTNKQTNKNSAQISPYMKLTETTGPTLGGQKSKGRKNSTLKPGKRKPQT